MEGQLRDLSLVDEAPPPPYEEREPSAPDYSDVPDNPANRSALLLGQASGADQPGPSSSQGGTAHTGLVKPSEPARPAKANHTFLDRAIEIVRRAVDADYAAEYEKAYADYYTALELFMLAIKYEANPSAKDLIRNKATEYIARAEKLKDHLYKKDTRHQQRTSRRYDGAMGNASESAPGPSRSAAPEIEVAGFADPPELLWQNIVGAKEAKALLEEAAILPLRLPQLFKGSRRPINQILLFGPPGVGKSALAGALAYKAKRYLITVDMERLLEREG
jgi:vacuolar protein-sorting-associated protein 4